MQVHLPRDLSLENWAFTLLASAPLLYLLNLLSNAVSLPDHVAKYLQDYSSCGIYQFIHLSYGSSRNCYEGFVGIC